MINDNSKCKLMLDLDACICNTPRMISKYSKEMFNIGPGDVSYQETIFNIEDAWPEMNFQKLKQIFHLPEFWQDIKPFHRVIGFTKQLSKWFEVHIVTDRRWYPELLKETESWLLHNNITYHELVIVKGVEKGEYCKSNNVIIAVEDKLINVAPISEVCPVILMDWPYNRVEGLQSNVYRCESYYKALKQIADLTGNIGKSWEYPQSMEPLYEQ